MKKKNWIDARKATPENDALCLLVCDHDEIEGGRYLELGYYDGFRWMKENDREQCYPTHGWR